MIIPAILLLSLGYLQATNAMWMPRSHSAPTPGEKLKTSLGECTIPATSSHMKIECGYLMTKQELKELKLVDKVYFVSNLPLNRRSYGAEYDLSKSSMFPSVYRGDQMQFRYNITGLAGKGSYGRVIKVADMANGGKLRAVKFALLSEQKHELKMLEHVRNKQNNGRETNTVQLLDTFLHRKWKAFVFPYYSQTWKSYLNDTRVVPLEELKALTMQMLNSLSYLKSKEIIHLDIKPANILLDTTETGKMNSVLTDFGLSVFKKDAKPSNTGGTLEYSAPEVLLGYAPISYDADMWSLGATVYNLLTGRPLINCTDSDVSIDVLRKLSSRMPNHSAVINRKPFPKLTNSHGNTQDYTRTMGEELDKVLSTNYEGEEDDFIRIVRFIEGSLEWNPENRLKVEDAIKIFN